MQSHLEGCAHAFRVEPLLAVVTLHKLQGAVVHPVAHAVAHFLFAGRWLCLHTIT